MAKAKNRNIDHMTVNKLAFIFDEFDDKEKNGYRPNGQLV